MFCLKKENSFIKAGAILVVSGFIVKRLSAAYRIPLTRMLGASLMGKYSAVINIFMPFFSFATAGIVPAVARYTAVIREENDDIAISQLSKQALGLYISVAAVLAIGFIAFGRWYSLYNGENLYFTGAIILAPAIPLAAMEMVFKGVTQGKMDMLITAKSNVIEGVVKTVFGIATVFLAVNYMAQYHKDLPVALCLGSVTVSGFVCTAYLTGKVKIPRYKKCIFSNINIKKQLISVSVPIAASALVVSLVNFFDTAVCLPIIKNLPYGEIVQSFDGASFMGAEEVSVYLLGIYQGMVLTVFNLVPVIMSLVGMACMPVITRAQTFADKTYLYRQVDRLYRVTAFLSVPASVFIFCFRREITMFLFGTSAGQTEIAAQLMAIIIPFTVPCCFISSFNAIINAYGKSKVSFKILVVASLVRCVLSFVLCSCSGVNIKAFAVSAAVFYTIIFVINGVYICRLGIKFNPFKIIMPPVLVAVIMAVVLHIFIGPMVSFLPLVLKLLLQGIIFCTGYMLMVYITGFTVDIYDKK